jgi:TfoX/Sxy family transcriptional regulator of competence genes
VDYDETLAQRIRDVIGVRTGVVEKRMFGGICWMVTGNLAVGTLGEDLMVRLGSEDAERAVAEQDVAPMEMGGRPMRAWVRVDAAVIADDGELARWVDAGADFAASLPPK